MHAIDLRGSVLDVGFKVEETYFIGDGVDSNIGGGKNNIGGNNGGGFRKRRQLLQSNTNVNILSPRALNVDADTATTRWTPDNNDKPSESSETFASIILSFTGTAAILQGYNIPPFDNNNNIENENFTNSLSLYKRPTIGRDELRLALRGSFAPPDGPYQFLSLVLESANNIRQKNYPVEEMSHSDRMEYDAGLVLGGSRQVKVRTDLDLYPDSEFVGQHDEKLHAATFGVSSGSSVLGASTIFGNTMTNAEAEKRESIAVFLEGAYLVLFLGGFYLYASYKYRRMHLKQELYRYGEKDGNNSILVLKDEESGLFSRSLNSKLFHGNERRGRGGGGRRGGGFTVIRATRFGRLGKWVGGAVTTVVRRGKDGHSHETIDFDGEDGFFERELSGVESSDEGDGSNDSRSSLEYCEESSDLEKGLRESYDESNRFRRGLDMNPIDAVSHGRDVGSPGSHTMKAVDDEMRERSTPPMGGWGNVLDSVVPIPASDSVKGVDDRDATYNMSGPHGDVLVQRRYVQPASPFDVLYGAAFLHGEADRVEAQRRMKKNKQRIRSSPSARRRKKKKKASTMKLVADAMHGQRSTDAIRPMMTITEVEDAAASAKELFAEEDEDEYDSDENDEVEESVGSSNTFGKLGPGELRHNPSPMSFYSPSNFMRNLSERYNLGLFDPLSSEEIDKAFDSGAATLDATMNVVEEQPKFEDFPVEEGVVFRDFPRQDGTPCLIYDVTEEDVKSSFSTTDDVAAPQAVDEVERIVEDENSIFGEDVSVQ